MKAADAKGYLIFASDRYSASSCMTSFPGILPVKGKQMKENQQFLTNPTWFKQLLFKVITGFQGFMRGLLAGSTSPH